MTKEIDALSRAADTEDGGHRNVVRYYGKDEDQFFVYICMELCDTETLDSRIKKMGGEDLRMDAVQQLFSGIEYLHELNIIHRDLKPANILFRGAVLKICDMGQVGLPTTSQDILLPLCLSVLCGSHVCLLALMSSLTCGCGVGASAEPDPGGRLHSGRNGLQRRHLRLDVPRGAHSHQRRAGLLRVAAIRRYPHCRQHHVLHPDGRAACLRPSHADG